MTCQSLFQTAFSLPSCRVWQRRHDLRLPLTTKQQISKSDSVKTCQDYNLEDASDSTTTVLQFSVIRLNLGHYYVGRQGEGTERVPFGGDQSPPKLAIYWLQRIAYFKCSSMLKKAQQSERRISTTLMCTLANKGHNCMVGRTGSVSLKRWGRRALAHPASSDLHLRVPQSRLVQ